MYYYCAASSNRGKLPLEFPALERRLPTAADNMNAVREQIGEILPCIAVFGHSEEVEKRVRRIFVAEWES